MLLLKNPQFLRNHNETWSKCGTHGLFIFTKFCNDCIKIVDFLIKAHFWVTPDLPWTHCKCPIAVYSEYVHNIYVFEFLTIGARCGIFKNIS